MQLNIGDTAPEFSGATDGGNSISSADFAGKWLVLYFYPKDNTSGCTKEACSFKDNMQAITGAGAVVVGVSPDSPASHDKFKDKFELNFALLSDTTKEICQAYSAYGEKSMYGKKYMGVVRSTFIIDPEGVIRYANYKVKAADHALEIIKELKTLQG